MTGIIWRGKVTKNGDEQAIQPEEHTTDGQKQLWKGDQEILGDHKKRSKQRWKDEIMKSCPEFGVEQT